MIENLPPADWSKVRTRWRYFAAAALFVLMGGVIALQQIDTARTNDARRAERDRQAAAFARQDARLTAQTRKLDRLSDQFCAAIPNVAAASQQALINILVQNAPPDTTDAEVAETLRLGRLLVAEARRLAQADLPDCPKPPKENP